jgi:hypothetical protein
MPRRRMVRRERPGARVAIIISCKIPAITGRGSSYRGRWFLILLSPSLVFFSGSKQRFPRKRKVGHLIGASAYLCRSFAPAFGVVNPKGPVRRHLEHDG